MHAWCNETCIGICVSIHDSCDDIAVGVSYSLFQKSDDACGAFHGNYYYLEQRKCKVSLATQKVLCSYRLCSIKWYYASQWTKLINEQCDGKIDVRTFDLTKLIVLCRPPALFHTMSHNLPTHRDLNSSDQNIESSSAQAIELTPS
jgi:hypothetical protein